MPLKDIRAIRFKKRAEIKNPYPIKVKRSHSIIQVLADFEALASKREVVSLVGRIRAIREHGGSTFINIEDESSKIQAYLKRDVLGKENYDYFLDYFDIGDFVQLEGTLFITKRGEKTLEVKSYRMLAKSLLPLPEKWHGLKDVEERFRKRYLDMLVNPEVRSKLNLRIKIIEELREVLKKEGFKEVETPILQSLPGGALAKPFKTYSNALKMDLYLRISPELYLKRLLIGGFEKIYEIGKCFRNEGIDWSHNPEFTMLELYWAYQERDNLMKFIEEILYNLVKKIKGQEKFSYQGQEINFKPPLPRKTFHDLVKQYANVDLTSSTESQLKKKIKELGIKMGKKPDKVALLDELYKKTVLPRLIQPTFVVDHPIEMAILAKTREDNPSLAHRFQLVVAGMELVNGFSELNDPVEQRKRFEESNIAPERKDKDFLEAMEYGMPPAAGLGMGIDRLVILLTDSHSIREVIAFPTMKHR